LRWKVDRKCQFRSTEIASGVTQSADLRLTETAEIDLAEIWSYFAEETSESFAAEFLSRIGDRFNQALQFPLSGAPRAHLSPDLRVVFDR
jgi:plasmid stabilization system protein ParE